MKKISLLMALSLSALIIAPCTANATTSLTSSKKIMSAQLKKDSERYIKYSILYLERSKKENVKSPEAYIALSNQMKSLATLALTLNKALSTVKSGKQLRTVRQKMGNMHLMAANNIRVAIEANQK